MEKLIFANLHLLNQAERLLITMPDHDYADPVGNLYGATLGQHLRHCLDHYSSFLGGLPDRRINYDHRERLATLESSTGCALEEVKRLKSELLEYASGKAGTSVSVKMDCGEGKQVWQQSTLGRELQFLVSHTVHHFAMINGMCRQRGLSMEEGFGIAPSTLRHRALDKID